MDSSSRVRKRADEAAAKLRAIIDRGEIDNAPTELVRAFSKVARAMGQRASLTDNELDRLSDQADAVMADVAKWLVTPAEERTAGSSTLPTEKGYAPFDPVAARRELDADAFNAEAAFDEFLRVGRTDRHCLRCGGQFDFINNPSGYAVTCRNGDYRWTVRGL